MTLRRSKLASRTTERGTAIGGSVGRAVVVTAVTAILLFPVYWMVVTSVTPTTELFTRDPGLMPTIGNLTFDAYVDVFSNHPVGRWLLNSGAITLASAVIATAVSALGGYSLSRFKTRGSSAMGYSLLFSRMLPGTLLVIPFFVMASATGLTNSRVSVVVINVGIIIPFTTWMMKSFIDGIPRELEEAGRVDGCSYIGALLRIVLPLSAPGIVAVFTYSSILAWGDFLFARTLLTDNSLWPITVGIASFVGEYTVDWAGLMAVSLLSSLPLILLFVGLQKFLVSGLTGGSVKG